MTPKAIAETMKNVEAACTAWKQRQAEKNKIAFLISQCPGGISLGDCSPQMHRPHELNPDLGIEWIG